ncbi:hypothetical protein NK6_4533 [Bradyrhizobium diazoefficiens]|uniref:Mutator family transposase n=1 Tax=Bradyrhizobium diazoefficiens TaxID=1355477 RepID=A0A0E3VUN1_9BRAD|nr:hypothetical protein NK6_4533 [Bradyrhizobium diazoefficiens]
MDEAFADVRASFDRFCLAAGIEALGTMMEADVTAACGARHDRDAAALCPAGQPGLARAFAPTVPRLFIADGAKALSKAIRRTFGSAAAIQRCQIHKPRNIMERLPKEHHAATRRVLRQAWEFDDADKAEKLIRNLARRLDQQWPGVAASSLEGLDEI